MTRSLPLLLPLLLQCILFLTWTQTSHSSSINSIHSTSTSTSTTKNTEKISNKRPNKNSFGQIRVLLVSPGYPWQFGAYQSQQLLLGEELLNRGYDVYWNSAFRQTNGIRDSFSVEGVVKVETNVDNKPKLPKGKLLKRAKQFTYIGVPLPPAFQNLGRGVLASAVNRQLVRHSIDAIICLMDANQIMMDEEFKAFSIMWFPNHFTTLHRPQDAALKNFDVVASLAPTDADMLRNPKYELKRVEVIPHIIELPRDLSFKSTQVIKMKYNIPTNAWVILVNCGNYEKHNRKSLDTILLAFKEFREMVPEAFLFLKAVASREILVSEGYPRTMQVEDSGLPLQNMAEIMEIPSDSYVIETRILHSNAAFELLKVSDMLLMPSKTEGFGLPMLEAQLMGVPVVTTRFGAMKDYTINGYAVPPSQPIFMQAGVVMMPDLNGVVKAMKQIYDGELDRNPTNLSAMAVDWITDKLSSETVGGKFDTLLQQGVEGKAVDDMFKRPSERRLVVDDDNDGEEDAQYGDDTTEYFFSMPYQNSSRLHTLRAMRKGECPGWTLLWSEDADMDWSKFDALRQQGWGTSIPPSEGDVIFLLSRAQDGTTFPTDNDLLMGIVHPDCVVMIRTDRFLAAAKYHMLESRGMGTGALDVLKVALAVKAPIERPINIKVIHVVVAIMKHSVEISGDGN